MTAVRELQPSIIVPEEPIPAVFQRHPELLAIPPHKFPNSVLIIPDGNGRFAQTHGLPITEGHKAGAKALKKAVEFFVEIPEIKRLVVWGFSHDNWKRDETSPGEVDGIMAVTEATILGSLEMFHKHKIRFRRIGRPERIQEEYKSLWHTIIQAEQETAGYINKELVLALDFSGKDQVERMLAEFGRICMTGISIMDPKESAAIMVDLLRDGGGTITPVDLIARTSGENRTSDIGWIGENSEFFPIEKLLPDVTEKDFADVLIDYSKRERRFGARPTPSTNNTA